MPSGDCGTASLQGVPRLRLVFASRMPGCARDDSVLGRLHC